MNRLTKSRPLTECEAMNLSLTDLYMRLKAYEDTGLEPEKIRELLHDSTGPLHKKLGEWVDAEQDGRLLVLPCKVGDDLFYILNGEIYEGKLYRIAYENYQGKIHTDISADRGYSAYGAHFEDFGKTVFLTREDAKKALEGMDNDER